MLTPRKLELRFINLYFWMFWLQCIHGTYLNLFLKRQGFSGTDIGITTSVFALTGVLVTPFIGLKFDRSSNRPAFLVGLTLLAGISFTAYSQASSLAHLIPMAAVLGAGWLALIPLLDSLTFSKAVTSAARHGYGGYRRWGSLGFAVAGLVVGFLAWKLGLWVIFPCFLACTLIIASLATGIPLQAIPAGDRTLKLSAVLDLLRLPNFRMFLLTLLLAATGSSACWSFRAIYLDSIGVPELAIGALWILPIMAEVGCFTLARPLVERWGTGVLITAGLLVGTVRWWLLSFMTYSPWLFITETLHGVSFALFYAAAVTFVQREVPERLRGTAQVMFFSTIMGLGASLGAFLGGRMYDEVGMLPVLRIAGSLGGLAGVLQMLLVRHVPARRFIPPAPTVGGFQG